MVVGNIESNGPEFEPVYDGGVMGSELPSGLFSGKLQDIERDSFLDDRDASLLGTGLGALSGGYLFSGVDSSGLPGITALMRLGKF